MMSSIVTKLKPAPLAYPNGGGLKSMANKAPASQKLEVEALKKKHEVELAKLQEKHAKVNQPKPTVKKNG
jgi:hypothetical protein